MQGNLSRTPPQSPKHKIINEVKNILNISSLFKFTNIFCELTPRLRNVWGTSFKLIRVKSSEFTCRNPIYTITKLRKFSNPKYL